MLLYLLEDLVLGFTPDVQLRSEGEGRGGYNCDITAYLVPRSTMLPLDLMVLTYSFIMQRSHLTFPSSEYMFSLNPLTMVLSMNRDLMTTMAFRTFPKLTWKTQTNVVQWCRGVYRSCSRIKRQTRISSLLGYSSYCVFLAFQTKGSSKSATLVPTLVPHERLQSFSCLSSHCHIFKKVQ